MTAVRLIVFAAASAALAYASRAPLRHPRSHGFPRFFAWECMVLLLLVVWAGVGPWFADPLSARQTASWALLACSLVSAMPGGLQLLRRGRPRPGRADEPALFGFERTTALVTTGVYRYVRHPLYGSLVFLTWGVFFKGPSLPAAGLALAATVLLTATARREEAENLRYFGDAYTAYRKTTRMFVPFVV